MKKVISILLATALTASMLAGCGGKTDAPAAEAPAEDSGQSEAPAEGGEEAAEPAAGGTIKVAAIETAYGSEMWQEVCEIVRAHV